jgi:hypothetical protein
MHQDYRRLNQRKKMFKNKEEEEEEEEEAVEGGHQPKRVCIYQNGCASLLGAAEDLLASAANSSN